MLGLLVVGRRRFEVLDIGRMVWLGGEKGEGFWMKRNWLVLLSCIILILLG